MNEWAIRLRVAELVTYLLFWALIFLPIYLLELLKNNLVEKFGR